MTLARYSQPSSVGIQVTSPHQATSTWSGSNRRPRWLLFCVRFVHEQVSWQTPGALSPDLEDLL
jgi:hypothetical protein